jgi:hypothetical protein
MHISSVNRSANSSKIAAAKAEATATSSTRRALLPDRTMFRNASFYWPEPCFIFLFAHETVRTGPYPPKAESLEKTWAVATRAAAQSGGSIGVVDHLTLQLTFLL